MVTTPTRSRFAWRYPLSYLGIHGIVGLALSAACAWAFFWLADEIPEKGAIVRFDIAVTAWLQAHGTEPGESVFVGVSYLGAQVLIAVLVILAIVFVVRREWRKLTVLAATCGGGAMLNVALKSAFHRARPDVASEFNVTSWSFPSGHAMDSFIVYGVLAYWLGRRFPRHRRWIFAAAAALVVAIGYARIYLGVHYLSDVLAGYSAGLVWLLVCITGAQFADRRQIASPGVAPAAGAARHPADSFSA
jgi:membrane-associated phospholipid phosphatase